MTNDTAAAGPSGQIFTLEAEVDAAAAGAPIDPGTPAIAAHQVADDEPWRRSDWPRYTKMASNLLCGLMLPQWEITSEEKTELSESLAMILYTHFPDGVNGRYAGYFRLIAASSVIVAARITANNGKLPPLGPPRPAADPKRREAPAARSSTPDPHAPVVN
ncbi:MAG TPA: hypothetical protein VFA39_18970 [Steroidobacteraceae bacterium]|nr:hypothetical protein [Steroidobacteraceae bacterium]